MRLVIILLAIFTQISASCATEDANSSVDTLIEQSGLAHLPESDRKKLSDLIVAVIDAGTAESAKQAHLAALASNYFSAQGYKLLFLQLAQVDGKAWLVVNDTFQRYTTYDLPVMFPKTTFRDGYYFCKPEIIIGISKMIDETGKEQSFSFAKWKQVR